MKPRVMINFPDSSWIKAHDDGSWDLKVPGGYIFCEPEANRPELHNVEAAEASARAARDKWILRQWENGSFMAVNNVQKWLAPLIKIGPRE